MGQSHFKSNLIGKNGTEYIASMAAVKTVANDNGYLKIGGSQYLIVGNSNTEATVLAEATALVGATIVGSLYLGRSGQAWFMTTNASASPIGMD
jgi:hypothetical protein